MKGKVKMRLCGGSGRRSTVRFAVSFNRVLQVFFLTGVVIYFYSSISCSTTPIPVPPAQAKPNDAMDCRSPRDKYAHLRVTQALSFHLCLRTKNADQHLSELLSYYFYHGVTSISMYDDSDNNRTRIIVERFLDAGFKISYFFVNSDSPRKHENSDLLECYTENFPWSDFIMNVDDDEFFFPAESTHPGYRIIDALQDARAPCISLPIYFFGTSGLSTLRPEENTITSFVKRDSDVGVKEYLLLKSTNTKRNLTTFPRAFYMYKRKTSRTKKKRIQKAIFSPLFIPDKEAFLQRLTTNYKAGSLIHGYKMGCRIEERPPLAVAHYTRSEAELETRLKTFWKTTIGLRHRFATDQRRETYISERNRNAQRDVRLTKYDSCIKLFRKINKI